MDGISHITYIVRDLDRMARFLCHGLGAQEVFDSNKHSFTLAHEKFFVVGGLYIAAMKGDPPRERTYQHLAFKVRAEELPVYRERLAALGVEFRPARKRLEGEGDSLYFYDFDDHLFELHVGTLEERLRRYAE